MYYVFKMYGKLFLFQPPFLILILSLSLLLSVIIHLEAIVDALNAFRAESKSDTGLKLSN